MSGNYIQNAGVYIVELLFGLYILVVLVRFLLQTARANFYNPISQFVVKATNPLLVPLRRVIPGYGGIDIAALALLYVLQAIKITILKILTSTPLVPLALLIAALASLVDLVTKFYFVTIFIQILMSWINPMARNDLLDLLHSVNEPVMRPARNLLPPMGGIDFSPIIVIVLLQLVGMLIVAPLNDWSMQITLGSLRGF
ncbi:MAG TPA: YggT family protein [Gammaproteobacteria bacterium]|nr:YggT family protein [Gammaproteobacteria bacterium]